MKKLVYYAGAYTISAGLLKLAGFVVFLWPARTLSVDDYGRFGLLYALQTALATFALAGIVESVVGSLKEHRSEAHQRQLFAAANSAFLLMTVTAIVFALLVFIMLRKSSETTFLALSYVLVSGAFLAFASFQAQIIRLLEKHLSSLCFSFFMPLAGLVGSFVAFFLQGTVQSFFLGSTIGLLIASVSLWVKRIGFYGIVDRTTETWTVLLKAIPFIAIAFFGWLSGYGNNYVVNGFFKSAEVARFTFALTLSSIMQLIASAMNQVWSPRFYRITHELPFDQVEKKNWQFYRLQGVALGFVGGIVIVIFPPTLKALGGNLIAYQSMSLELFLLFSSYVVLSPWWHCNNYYLAYSKGEDLMRIVLVTSAVGIPTLFMLMWLIGPIGVYIGFMTQMLLRTLGIVFAAKKRWPVKIGWDGVVGGVLITYIGFVLSKT